MGFKFTYKFKPTKKDTTGDGKRDPNTIDLFYKLSDKQIDTFGSKLANDNAFGSKYARIGEDNKAFEQRVKNELRHLENQKNGLTT